MTDRVREGWEKALSDCFDSSVQEGGAAAGWNEVCDRLAVRRRRRVAARSAIALCCSALVLGGLAIALRPQGVVDSQSLLAQEQSAASVGGKAQPVSGTRELDAEAPEPELAAKSFGGDRNAVSESSLGSSAAGTSGSGRVTGESGSKKTSVPEKAYESVSEEPFKTGDVLALAEELPGRRRGPQIGVGLEIGGMPATSGTLNISGGVAANSVQRFESPGVEVFQASAEAISSSATYRHHMPLGAGLKLNIGLTERLSLTTGLNYTLLWSELQPLGSEGKSDQYLHYIGVPLGAEYHLLSKGAFALSAGAGISLDFLAAAYIDRRKVDDKPLQWTANLNAAAHWELSSHLSLYLQPELNWYISKTGVNSIRNDSPLGATLRIGLRLNL